MSLTLLYIVFVLTAIVLITVILLQEGKGGGFSDALGAAGQQTFGVKAKGIQTFTGWAIFIFLASAVVITKINDSQAGSSVLGDSVLEAPVDDAGAGAGTDPVAPAGGSDESGAPK